MSTYRKKLLVSLIIFSCVFISYAIAFRNYWFWQDDLGVIINGMVKDWNSFLKIFTDDIRNYITSYNFNVPKPNILSGFMRPIQNIFFSIIYSLFGYNAYAFVLLNVLFHALNSVLFFFIMTNFIPISYSALGAILLAFYPCMRWLAWICTLQQSLALFFLLLAILLFLPLLKKIRSFATSPLFYLSGFSFLLSLLSRETFVMLAGWFFFGAFLFADRHASFWQKIKISFAKTWIFFVATIIYFAMRLNAYGFGTISRTMNSILIRFPFFKFLLPVSTSKLAAQTTIRKVSTTAAAPLAKTVALTTQPTAYFTKIKAIFFQWSNLAFNVSAGSPLAKTVITIFLFALIIFLFYSYRKHIKLLFFFLAGIPFFVWPCVLVYPHVRYFSAAYPLLIALVLVGIYFFTKFQSNKTIKLTIMGIFLCIFSWSLAKGFYKNIVKPAQYKYNLHNRSLYKFAQKHSFPKNSHLVFISTAGKSDVTERLQVMANNFSLKVANIPISELAQSFKYGLNTKYRLTNTAYSIKPIPMGFRFISLEKNHCAWYFRSYQPVRWVEKDRSYSLASSFFKANRWYRFSLGKFFIHEITDKKYVTDVSMVFDKKWIIPNTFFVTWDTMGNKYKVLDSSHID